MNGEILKKVLEMSLMGSYSVLVMLAVRFLMGKLERKYVYYLWLVVFLNFCIPFSFHGKYSLIPAAVADFSLSENRERDVPDHILISAEDMDRETAGNRTAALEKEPAYPEVSKGVQEKPDPAGVSESIQQKPDSGEAEYLSALYGAVWRRGALAQRVWLAGILMILLWNLAGIFRTKRMIARKKWTAFSDKNRIAKVKDLPMPFVWGLFRPIIFIPSDLEKEEQCYIVAHENCHRRRRDPLIKILAFLVVSMHWFNPFIWLAWALFCRDMEISCDEAVLAESGKNIKKQYAQSLLKYAARQNGYQTLTLTFGEPSVKTRIKNVLRFKKRNAAITVIAGICVVVIALGLLVRPDRESKTGQKPPQSSVTDVENSEPETGAYLSEQPETDVENMASTDETADEEQESPTAPAAHREGYREVSLTYADLREFPFEEEILDENRRDELAQRAMRELYDLTGYQIEEACYEYTIFGDFYFARTAEDLKHSRTFFDRCFGGEEFNMSIPSMMIGSRRRLWFSDVDQMDVPDNIEEMSNGELAIWFLQHSALYGGEKVAYTEPAYEMVRVYMTDGTYYEVQLDRQINSLYSIYGPYSSKKSD